MSTKRLLLVEILLIVLFALVPLFINLPYRINIFLSWEGAYRMSMGQLPFRDFGSPIGGAYWIIPAFFFKIFGPQMFSLIKAQVFLNIISGLSFQSILRRMQVDPQARFIAIVVFILSFSFINFWPWYNHTVIVYELVALAFLLKYLYAAGGKFSYLNIITASFFSIFSFLTKQDAGALTILICFVLLLYSALAEKKWLPLVIYFSGLVLFFFTYIFFTNQSSFQYWFNHGQAPHSSRVHIIDFLEEFFGAAQWIKFYLFLMIILCFQYLSDWRNNLSDKRIMIPILLTFGLMAEALIFSVTSYIPPDNNIFFHSFAIAFILNKLIAVVPTMRKHSFFYLTIIMVLLWWSPNYWRYMQVIIKPFTEKNKPEIAQTENIVDRNTYKISTIEESIPLHDWRISDLPTLKNITLPAPTIEGINRLKNLDLIKENKALTVLNMSELTSLAAEIPFKLENGPDYPLWFHLGVGMFNKQAEMFESRIIKNHYDLVLFENIPALNNFYPFRVRDTLKQYYQLIDSFPAPRKGDIQGEIEVFIKK
ncbi:MAG TPA: hypothetical protein VLR49_06665 [Ferruginibacter sp.]|nr:hypothetical protein [Ferruginibacter sp.]